jgi:hypothetical protein
MSSVNPTFTAIAVVRPSATASTMRCTLDRDTVRAIARTWWPWSRCGQHRSERHSHRAELAHPSRASAHSSVIHIVPSTSGHLSVPRFSASIAFPSRHRSFTSHTVAPAVRATLLASRKDAVTTGKPLGGGSTPRPSGLLLQESSPAIAAPPRARRSLESRRRVCLRLSHSARNAAARMDAR